jgi:holin-like protein
MIPALLAVLGCHAFGEVLVAECGLPIPGAVIGMTVLFACFAVNGGVPDDLARLFDIAMPHLPLFFIPAGVGVVAETGAISQGILPVAVGIVGGTAATIAATAIAADWAGRIPAVRPRHEEAGE